MTKTTSNSERTLLVPALLDFSAAVIVLAEEAPERLTLPQTAFFLAAAVADLNGKSATFGELREALGPIINRSLHTTYRVFLDEGRNRGEKREPGLGWLTRDTDPKDNRRKYLRLTDMGRAVLHGVATAGRMKGH